MPFSTGEGRFGVVIYLPFRGEHRVDEVVDVLDISTILVGHQVYEGLGLDRISSGRVRLVLVGLGVDRNELDGLGDEVALVALFNLFDGGVLLGTLLHAELEEGDDLQRGSDSLAAVLYELLRRLWV